MQVLTDYQFSQLCNPTRNLFMLANRMVGTHSYDMLANMKYRELF
jgi:hypothetical protein